MTLRSFIRNELGLNKSDSDLSFYIHHANDELFRLTGTYVEDFCSAGHDSFGAMSSLIEDHFDSKERKYDDFHFEGVDVQNKDGKIYMDQLAYAQRLKKLLPECSLDDFSSAGHTLAWLAQSIPDVCASENILSQVTVKSHTEKHTKALNKVIQHVLDTPDRSLVHSAPVSYTHLTLPTIYSV